VTAGALAQDGPHANGFSLTFYATNRTCGTERWVGLPLSGDWTHGLVGHAVTGEQFLVGPYQQNGLAIPFYAAMWDGSGYATLSGTVADAASQAP
jgi:hypothetical protein